MTMIVPQYWAQATATVDRNGKKALVRRFGWSDQGSAKAQEVADARLAEALALIHMGRQVAYREPKVPYSGAEGVPIREEIIEKVDQCVITRNSYGALCLNTPDVAFADIDFDKHTPPRWLVVGAGAGMVAALAGAFAAGAGSGAWVAAGLAGAMVGALAGSQARKATVRAAGGHEAMAMARIRAFSSGNPDWHLRAYRTFAGIRVLVMHAPLDPRSPATQDFFQALGVDRLYARMCLRQHCFRARLTPKPWRIGVGERLRPRAAVWPIPEEKMPARRKWVEGYDRASAGYAVCRLIQSLGPTGRVAPQVEPIARLHDLRCGVGKSLPLA